MAKLTVKNGCPSSECMLQDTNTILDRTINCIIEAQGAYIDDKKDMVNKKEDSRHGYRQQARLAEEKKKKKNPLATADPKLFLHLRSK